MAALPVMLAMLACGGDLPRPRYVPQVSAALVPVGYPPPPARVEFIPESPRSGAVWIDGEWGWIGSKWAWTKGRWVEAPTNASFSPWTMVRDEVGTVYFASGIWKDQAGHPLPPPPPLAAGRARPGDVTSPEGDDEKTGPSSAVPAPPVSAAPQSRP
jgi:hypothetical protein